MRPVTPPTALELRAYALGRLDRKMATEIERYLLLSGDNRAMRLVSAFTKAHLRVKAYEREEQAVSWLATVLERLGSQVREVLASAQQAGLELLHPSLIGTTLGPRGSEPLGAQVRYHADGEERYLHVLVADSEGHWSILYPDVGLAQKAERTTPSLPVPVGVKLAVGIASPRPLFAAPEERRSPIRLENALSSAGLTLLDVALSRLDITDEEE